MVVPLVGYIGWQYPVDAHSAHSFLNSSLAPVIQFRRRIMSVLDVLGGIRQMVLLKLGGACGTRCFHGLTRPIQTFVPWTHWVPADLHGFFKSVVDGMELLNLFRRG